MDTTDVEAFTQDLINRMNSNLPGVVAALPRLTAILDSIPETGGTDAAMAGAAAVAGKAAEVFAALRADPEIPQELVDRALRNTRLALLEAQVGLVAGLAGGD